MSATTTPTTQAIQTQIDGLKESINLMDGFSQDSFSRIAAIARLALLAMETQEGQQDTEVYASAFEVIRYMALDTENLINCEAENSGDHYKDEAMRRRADARGAFRDAQMRQGGAA